MNHLMVFGGLSYEIFVSMNMETRKRVSVHKSIVV